MRVDIAKGILEKNDTLAEENRALFAANGVFVVDLMASPGAGKTSTHLGDHRRSARPLFDRRHRG